MDRFIYTFIILKGAVLAYVKDENVNFTVVDDRKIEYHGEIMYMTTLAKMLTGKKTGFAGPIFLRTMAKTCKNITMSIKTVSLSWGK